MDTIIYLPFRYSAAEWWGRLGGGTHHISGILFVHTGRLSHHSEQYGRELELSFSWLIHLHAMELYLKDLIFLFCFRFSSSLPNGERIVINIRLHGKWEWGVGIGRRMSLMSGDCVMGWQSVLIGREHSWNNGCISWRDYSDILSATVGAAMANYRAFPSGRLRLAYAAKVLMIVDFLKINRIKYY